MNRRAMDAGRQKDRTRDCAEDFSPDGSGLSLIAYRLDDDEGMGLITAPASREWMNNTTQRFAYRCLPLLIANQAGWLILNDHTIRATWTGEDALSSLTIEYPDGTGRYSAGSHFGHGIITWPLPYLFRTPPRFNLLARGPSNLPKDGVCPLEGIIETDWATATFTMNWKVTRSHHPIVFEAGEPICMIVPQRRRELEAFRPEIHSIESAPDIKRGHQHWSDGRREFLEELKVHGSEAFGKSWQKDYFQGHIFEGGYEPEHQLKLCLKEFEEP